MYCYPGTDVLVNAFDIRDEDRLKELETVYALYRLSELQLKKPQDPSDLKVFFDIHHCLLQDVYPFAGKLREEMTSKGTSTFAHPKHLAGQLKQLFDELAEEEYLKGLKKDVFVRRLAHYLAELNALHPFREGNGRAVREFARQLALNAGYRLDWTKMEEPAHIINAFVDSFNKDNERLEALLAEIIS